ncbi:MAG: serine hydrolase [Gammaproteobacteria bacterium]|nr:serine hydrolase [Gammaproteobacteria bacterium]
MPNPPSKAALQQIAEAAYIPAIGYAYVEAEAGISTSVTVGKKNAESTEPALNGVDDHTRFPASSLSKIVFAYLVLQLVKAKKIDLDEPLYPILEYKRFFVDGEYPKKAQELTARHVLSHTTGLPNFGSNLSSTLFFDPESELGNGYAYSGEAFLYLQKAIETKMGQDLETLAKAYVFDPLTMDRSTFLPQSEDDANVVAVHTELGKPTSIYVGDPEQNAAGSLLTTGHDFSKFIAAWLDNMDDPIIQQAFKSTNTGVFPTCGLGWHIYKNPGTDEVIAYQYGENPNTRAFVAINVNDKKGAAFFTNSENGMSIATQILGSPDLAPIGNMQALFKNLHYIQSDEPGWQQTVTGKVAEDQGKFEEARSCYEEALLRAPEDKSKQQRLKWFDAVHQSTSEKQITSSLKAFIGTYKNPYNDEIEISIRDESLIYSQFGHETKIVQISETDFLPEKDQSFRLSINRGQMSVHFVHGGSPKKLSKQPSIAKFWFKNLEKPMLERVNEKFDLTPSVGKRGDRILYIHEPELVTRAEKPGILIFMDGIQEISSVHGVESTPEILDVLYQSEPQQVMPKITVFIPAPSSFSDRVDEYACNQAFSDFLATQLVPLLQEKFQCTQQRVEITVGGTSFGGLAATHAALTHPEVFGNVLAQSGAFWWHKDWEGFDKVDEWEQASRPDYSDVHFSHPAINMSWLDSIEQTSLPVNFYLDGGELEEHKTPSLNYVAFPGAVTLNARLTKKLIARGDQVTAEVREGDHEYSSWQANKSRALSVLELSSARLLVTETELAHALSEVSYQERKLQNLIQAHKVIGVSVAVLDNGDISTFSAGKLASSGEQELTPDGVFEAASLSKPVFAYIVLKMMERGEVDLDTPLCQLSQNGFGPPELRETSEYQQLTARMVLSHQTGLPNWWPHHFQAKPGTEFNYSGLAFNFLCDVIQESSGLSLEQLAKRELEPLGIVQSTYFYQPEDDSDEKMRFAVGHNAAGVPDEKSHYVKQSEENAQMPFEKPIPAASLFITARHYAKFLAACLQDKFIREHMFVDANDLGHGRDKKGSEVGVPPGMLNKLHWGLGMGIQDNSDGSKTLFHWGDSETFRNLVVSRVEEDGSYKGVVCLTNSANGAAVFRQISEPIVGNIEPISVWLREREKLNVSNVSFSTTAEAPYIQHTQSMREQLQTMKKLDSASSSETSHTPGIKGTK